MSILFISLILFYFELGFLKERTQVIVYIELCPIEKRVSKNIKKEREEGRNRENFHLFMHLE